MLRLLSFAFVLMCVSDMVSAQAASVDQSETIRLLSQQVKELQEKFAALEARQNLAVAAASAPVAPPIHAAAESSEPDANDTARPSILQELHEVHGIQWRGFGELSYKVLDRRESGLGTFGFVPGSAGNFYTGDFDLFLTSRISDRASVLSEIVIGERDAQSFNVELARALFKYDLNDHLKLAFGRYHTGIGYYNTAFHSGRWLQTSVDRPLIVEFANDGGLLPTQAVGVTATGQIPSGQWGLSYIAEYGSSDTLRPDLDAGGTIDENNGNHVNIGLFVRPDRIPGLQIGGSLYHDRISDFVKGPNVRLGQTIANAHVVYQGHGFESLNEGFLIREAYEHGGPVYNMPAFYSQVSKTFGKMRPYVRYQYVNANLNSVYNDDVLLRHGPSFGIRYDFSSNFAGKAQLDHTIRRGQPDLDTLQLQLAFAF